MLKKKGVVHHVGNIISFFATWSGVLKEVIRALSGVHYLGKNGYQSTNFRLPARSDNAFCPSYVLLGRKFQTNSVLIIHNFCQKISKNLFYQKITLWAL